MCSGYVSSWALVATGTCQSLSFRVLLSSDLRESIKALHPLLHQLKSFVTIDLGSAWRESINYWGFNEIITPEKKYDK